MAVVMGPVVKLLAASPAWCVSILVVTDSSAPPQIACAEASSLTASAPVVWGNRFIWRVRCAFALQAAARSVNYTVGDAPSTRSFTLRIPAQAQTPVSVYASCNGFSDPKLAKNCVQNAMWARLAKEHQRRGYHLLLLGGDQVYSDAMWEHVALLKAWCALDRAARVGAPWTPALQDAVEAYFLSIYCERWAQAEVALMLASIANIMMWDDHDIMDGWGSYADDMQASAVYQGIYAIARRAFALFQLHADLGAGERPLGTHPQHVGFTYGFHFPGLAVLDALPRDGHLYLMSSIPVVHPDFGLLEKALGWFPGEQEIEDDLRDHWTSLTHRKERLRLIHRLFKAAADRSVRITILSGDVHVGAVGVLTSARADVPRGARVINQLTSSGIVHPAPPGMALYFLEKAATERDQVDPGIVAEMSEFPATRRYFIRERNFLSLEPDQDGAKRIWANWFLETGTEPYTKVIHPVDSVKATQ